LRTAAKFASGSPHSHGARALVVLCALLSLIAPPSFAGTHWENLTPDEQKAVLAELQGLIKKDLEEDDARFVRNTWDIGDEGESEADDPLLKPVMKQLASIDMPALAQAAGSLSAGDYVPMRNFLAAKAAEEGGDALKDWAAKKLEKDGVGRLVFTTLADQTDGFKALLTSVLDPRQSWCDVADVAVEETRQAILTASRESAEELTKKTINWVLGEGPFASLGATPGDAYLMLLVLDAEYFRALPRRLGAQAGGRFYDEYEAARDNGQDPDSAFDQIDPWMATSDGRWFADLAGGMDGARRALERCYERTRAIAPVTSRPPPGRPSNIPSSSSVHILQCIDQRVEEKREEGEQSLCGETKSAGSATRDRTAQKLVWLTETLRRLTEQHLAARLDESLAQSQQIAAQARARLDDLRRLRAEQAGLCDRHALEAIIAPGTTAFAELDTIANRDVDVEIAIGRLSECVQLSDPGESVKARAHDLLANVRLRVADADTASTAACDWPDPTTVAAAQDNFRAATRAAGRLATADAAARRDLAELESLVLSVRSGALGQPDDARLARLRAARDKVTSSLARDARGYTLAATCRSASANWAERKSRLGRLYLAMLGMVDQIRRLTAQTNGLLDAVKIAADADQIRDEAETCDAVIAALTSRAAAFRESLVQSRVSAIQDREGQARAALAACAALDSPPPPPLSAVEADLGAARAEVSRLSAFQSAAGMCIAAAANKVDTLKQSETGAAPSGSDDAWTPVGDVQTVGSNTPPPTNNAGGVATGGPGPANAAPQVDGLIQAAIDAYNNCQMGAALGLARQVQSLAPNHPWLASNLALISRRQQAQSNAAAALSAARAAAASGDLRGAIAAANRAAADSPSCMSQTISSSIEQVRTQIATTSAEDFERNRQVFVQLVDSMINVWNKAATSGANAPVAGGAPGGTPRQVACSTRTEQGGDTPETIQVDVGNVSGTAMIRWDFYDIKDRMVVSYGGAPLLDTGCVGGRGTRPLPVSGFGGQVVVQVFPNCERKSGTQWEFTVECPR